MTDNYTGKGIENKDKNNLADQHEYHPHFCDQQSENYVPKIKEEPKQESSNKHPYGCHDDWDVCYECIDKYEELHTKQEDKLRTKNQEEPKQVGIQRYKSGVTYYE